MTLCIQAVTQEQGAWSRGSRYSGLLSTLLSCSSCSASFEALIRRKMLCCRWSSYFQGPDRLKLDSEEEAPVEQPEQNGSHMEGAAKMNGVSQAVDKLSIH